MRILLVKTSALGDIVHCFQVARYIKQHIPNAFIGWVVEKPFAELVKANPDVDKTYLIESKRWRKGLFSRSVWREVRQFRRDLKDEPFDLVIDLQGNIKSALITATARSKRKVGFAVPYVAERPSILTTNERYLPPAGGNIRDDYLYLAHKAINGPLLKSRDLPSVQLKMTEQQAQANRQFLQSLPSDVPYKVMVFPGAAWKNKQLSESDLQGFLQETERYLGRGILLAWGSADEHALAKRLEEKLQHAKVMDRLALPQLQNLIGSMQLVIAMDSLPLHLAATVQVPTYSFFGPSEAQKYAPQGDMHGVYQGACPYGVSFTRRCPKLRTCETGNCIRKIEVDPVFEGFKVWWERYCILKV